MLSVKFHSSKIIPIRLTQRGRESVPTPDLIPIPFNSPRYTMDVFTLPAPPHPSPKQRIIGLLILIVPWSDLGSPDALV